MNTVDEESDYGSKLAGDLIQMIDDEMDLVRWRFQLSHTKLEKSGSQYNTTLIYNSEWCRIKFSYRLVLGILDEPELHRSYGRLHAPNDVFYMVVNGETCRSWHIVGGFRHLYFLDGFSPSETMRNDKLPQVIEEFYQSDLHKRLRNERGPRNGIAQENAVWNHYGVRLFELFDLRHPNLWESYIRFLRELDNIENEERRIKGLRPITRDPPQWIIC